MRTLRIAHLGKHRQRENARLIVEGVRKILRPVPKICIRFQEGQRHRVVYSGLHAARSLDDWQGHLDHRAG